MFCEKSVVSIGRAVDEHNAVYPLSGVPDQAVFCLDIAACRNGTMFISRVPVVCREAHK